ncbi:GNAT family N-acetyltransferase [Candidatus Margulisiibacteriota bacterium]
MKDEKGLSLRLAEEKDCRLLWEWRNEEESRKSAFDSDLVPFDDHKTWFIRKLNDHHSQIVIILDNSSKEIGQVRFDVDRNNAAEIDVGIDRNERGKGYGAAAIRLACEYAFEKLNIKQILSHIKPDNIASQKIFAKAGFRNVGKNNLKDALAVEMVLHNANQMER